MRQIKSLRKQSVCSVWHTVSTINEGLSAPWGSDSKESACSAGDEGSTPGSRRYPGEVNGNPLQRSGLEDEESAGLQSMGSQSQIRPSH